MEARPSGDLDIRTFSTLAPNGVSRSNFIRRIMIGLRGLYSPYPYRSYMRKQKSIFIHIPKCGGTSVLTAFSKGGRIYRDHATAFEFHAANPYAFYSYEKFAVIRDPLDRALSTYRYILSGGNGAEDLDLQAELLAAGGTFESFVDSFLLSSKFYTHRLLWPQVNYLAVHGKISICNVIRLEQLDEFLRGFCLKKGLIVPERQNVTANDEADPLEVDALRPVIKRVYRWDYEILFGEKNGAS